MLRENVLLKLVLGPKREEGKESRRKLHNKKKPYILCSWLNVFSVIKPMNFIGRLCRENLKNEKMCTVFWSRKLDS